MATFDDIQGLSAVHIRPMTHLYATAIHSQEYMIPEGIPRPRTSRCNAPRLPVTPTRPSRGPWLAIGLCCPIGSSLTTASSEPLDPSRRLWIRGGGCCTQGIGFRWESRGSPIYSAELCSRAASLTPVAPKSANDCCFLLGVSLHLLGTGSATTLVVRGCRVHGPRSDPR